MGSHVIGGTGDLQPLQNLNQLTELNLRECNQLTGKSVSENLWGATAACDFIGQFLGTLAPLSGLSQLQMLNLRTTNFTGQSIPEICGGTTSTAFHSLSVSE